MPRRLEHESEHETDAQRHRRDEFEVHQRFDADAADRRRSPAPAMPCTTTQNTSTG